MKTIPNFEGFLLAEQERDISKKLIQFLHEGVRMVPVGSLNEGMAEKAQMELNSLIANSEGTPIVAEFMPEIMSLVKRFADSGQSGGSAPFTSAVILQVLKKLLNHEPLGGVRNTPDEWNDISRIEDKATGTGSFQNNRLSSVFKEGKDGRPYYINSVVFKPKGKNYTFTGSVGMTEGSEDKVRSSNFIKEFPFEPKTFVIEVDEKEYRKMPNGSLVEEAGGGWWESWIADHKQLDDVWEYYDRMEF